MFLLGQFRFWSTCCPSVKKGKWLAPFQENCCYCKAAVTILWYAKTTACLSCRKPIDATKTTAKENQGLFQKRKIIHFWKKILIFRKQHWFKRTMAENKNPNLAKAFHQKYNKISKPRKISKGRILRTHFFKMTIHILVLIFQIQHPQMEILDRRAEISR